MGGSTARALRADLRSLHPVTSRLAGGCVERLADVAACTGSFTMSMIDRIEFPDQASDEDGRHSRRARAAPAHAARFRGDGKDRSGKRRVGANRTARGATTRAQPSVRVRGSFTQGPSRSPRLARVRRPVPRRRARRDASRFADPCRSAIPTSRYDHRRGNRHEPSPSTDRRPAEIADTRTGPQGCPG